MHESTLHSCGQAKSILRRLDDAVTALFPELRGHKDFARAYGFIDAQHPTPSTFRLDFIEPLFFSRTTSTLTVLYRLNTAVRCRCTGACHPAAENGRHLQQGRCALWHAQRRGHVHPAARPARVRRRITNLMCNAWLCRFWLDDAEPHTPLASTPAPAVVAVPSRTSFEEFVPPTSPSAGAVSPVDGSVLESSVLFAPLNRSATSDSLAGAADANLTSISAAPSRHAPPWSRDSVDDAAGSMRANTSVRLSLADGDASRTDDRLLNATPSESVVSGFTLVPSNPSLSPPASERRALSVPPQASGPFDASFVGSVQQFGLGGDVSGRGSPMLAEGDASRDADELDVFGEASSSVLRDVPAVPVASVHASPQPQPQPLPQLPAEPSADNDELLHPDDELLDRPSRQSTLAARHMIE